MVKKKRMVSRQWERRVEWEFGRQSEMDGGFSEMKQALKLALGIGWISERTSDVWICHWVKYGKTNKMVHKQRERWME